MNKYTFLFLLIGCTSDEKTRPDQPPTKGYYDYIDLSKVRSEYLSPSRVLINGDLNIEIHTDSLLKKMGKPVKVVRSLDIIDDSIILEHARDSRTITYFIYRDLSFEVDGEYAHFKSIRFGENDNYVTINGKKINDTTKPMDIQKMFPETGRMLAGYNYDYSLMVYTRKEYAVQDFWVFSFGVSGLTKLSYHNF